MTMPSRVRRSKRDLLIIFGGRGLQAASVLIGVRLATTLMGPAEIGRVNVVVSLTALFSLIAMSPLANYMARSAIGWLERGLLAQSIIKFASYVGILALIAAAMAISIQWKWGIGIDANPLLLGAYVGLALVSGTLAATLSTILSTLGYRARYALVGNLSAWTGLGVAVALVLKEGPRAEAWLFGLLAGQALGALAASILIGRISTTREVSSRQRERVRTFGPKEVFHFSVPLVVVAGFYWIQTSGYRLVLARTADSETIGLFATGIALASAPLGMFEALFTEYFRPILYSEAGSGVEAERAAAWNRFARAFAPSVIVLSTLFGCSGEFLARVLVGPRFQGVAWLAIFGALIQASFMAYSAYVSLAFMVHNTRILIVPNACGAITVLVGMLGIAQSRPLVGTAISLALGMLVTAILTARAMRGLVSIAFPWRSVRRALILAGPLAIGLRVAALWSIGPSVTQAIVILAAAGVYGAVAIYLAREPDQPGRPGRLGMEAK